MEKKVWKENCLEKKGENDAFNNKMINAKGSVANVSISEKLKEDLSIRLKACVDCLVVNVLEKRKETLLGEWIPWKEFID